MPMASAMVDEVRCVGGNALLVHEDEDAWWRAIDRKQSKLLGRSSAPEWAAMKAADVYVMFWGPGDTDRIEKDHFSGDERTFDEALAWNSPWYEVARKTGLRGARMTAGFVTEGRAQKWGVALAQWKESVLRACLVDPEEMAKNGARLCKALSRGKKVRITHSNGTDLEVALVGAAPRLHDGRPHPHDKRYGPYDMLTQIPAGRVDVALDSKTAEGSIHANRRTNIWWHSHAGGTLEFADGGLTSYSFEEGEEDFARQYPERHGGQGPCQRSHLRAEPGRKGRPQLGDHRARLRFPDNRGGHHRVELHELDFSRRFPGRGRRDSSHSRRKTPLVLRPPAVCGTGIGHPADPLVPTGSQARGLFRLSPLHWVWRRPAPFRSTVGGIPRDAQSSRRRGSARFDPAHEAIGSRIGCQ